MNFSKQMKGLSRLLAAQKEERLNPSVASLNVVPSTLHTRMSLKEFLAWTNKECTSKEQFDNMEEINTFTYLRMNLKSFEKSSSDYNFAFQIRKPILPAGCTSLYLVNQNDETVTVHYKLRCIEKFNNRVSVQSLAEGVSESIDKKSTLYLDDLSIEGLKESADQTDTTRPIRIPTGKLTVICDILVLCNNGSSNQIEAKNDSFYSKSLILYL